MSKPYNGYTWQQRHAHSQDRHRLEASGDTSILAYLHSGKPCELCGDPKPAASSWHAEDYSLSFTWEPPGTFIVCKTCHGRLHKRFNQPWDWRLYLLHLRAGGYGHEFTQRNSLPQRRTWMDTLAKGEAVVLPTIRKRDLTGQEWWQGLTLEPESLIAAWARPRPFRSRPDTEAYRAALQAVAPSERERALLQFHACQPAAAPPCGSLPRGPSAPTAPEPPILNMGGWPTDWENMWPGFLMRETMARPSGCPSSPKAGSRRIVNLNGS